MTSTPHNPDDRDLLDFADTVAAGKNPQPTNDMERTYLHVQNALQGESAAIPPDLKQSTWEDVMSHLQVAPISNRTKRSQQLASTFNGFRLKRLQWTPMASIAAALLVIVASIGLWTVASDENTPPLPEQRPVAGLVPQPSTPVASPAPNSATCLHINEGTQVKVVSPPEDDGGNEDSITVWQNSDDDVMMRCPDGTEITIAENQDKVKLVDDTQIVVYVKADPVMALRTFYDPRSGTAIVEQMSLTPTHQTDINSHGKFQVLVSAADPTQWSVMNLETMREATLESLTGQRISSQQGITISTSSDQQHMAISASQYETEDAALVMRISGAPGDVMVINADLTEGTWVSIPDDMAGVNKMQLSEDGSVITLIADPSLGPGDEDWNVVRIDVTTGEEIPES